MIILLGASHIAVAILSGWVCWNIGYTNAQPRRDKRGRFIKDK